MARKSRKADAVQTFVTEVIYNTAIYVRLSVMDSGKKDSDTVINQQELLESYVAQHPELKQKAVFVDNGETGVDFIRPAWNDLMRQCRAGKINCIVLKDLSRFGRNYIETGEYLETTFPTLGIRLIAVVDNYDNLDLTTGKLLETNLKNLVNDMYAKDISRKSSAALKMKQKQGDFIGAYASYGYLKDSSNKNRIVVNPETAPIVKQIFEWKAEGVGNAEICRRLEAEGVPAPSKYNFQKGILKNKKFENSLWIPSTIRKMLRDQLYLGHMTQGKYSGALYEGKIRSETSREDWIIVHNTHEPIIDQDIFDRANSVMDERKRKYDENQGKYAHFGNGNPILTGLVFCADCGKSLMRLKSVTKSGKSAFWFYSCRTYANQKKCSHKYIQESELNKVVYELIRAKLKICANVLETIEKLNRKAGHKARLSSFDAEILDAEKQLHRIASLRQAIYNDYAAKLITVSEYQYAVEKYDFDTDKQQIRLSAAQHEKSQYKQSSTPENKWLTAFSEFMDSQKLTSEMAQALIEKIEVYDRNHVEVTFRYRDEYAAVATHYKGA